MYNAMLKSQQKKKKKGFLSVLGGVVGGMFGPVGAMIGSGIGSLADGGSPIDALISAGTAGLGAGLLGGNPLGGLGSGVKSTGLQMAFGGATNLSADIALKGIGGLGGGSFGFLPNIGNSFINQATPLLGQIGSSNIFGNISPGNIPSPGGYDDSYGWSQNLGFTPGLGIDYMKGIPTDLVLGFDKAEFGTSFRAKLRERAKEFLGDDWKDTSLGKFFNDEEKGAFSFVYDFLDDKLKGVTDALNPVLKGAQEVFGLGVLAKDTIDHYNFIQDTWNDIFHRGKSGGTGGDDLSSPGLLKPSLLDDLETKLPEELSGDLEYIDNLLGGDALKPPTSYKPPKYTPVKYKPIQYSPISYTPPKKGTTPRAPGDQTPDYGDGLPPADVLRGIYSPLHGRASGDRFVDNLSKLIESKLDAKGVLTTADAFNAFREREIREEKIPIKLQVQIGDQKLADILTNVQEAGYLERVDL